VRCLRTKFAMERNATGQGSAMRTGDAARRIPSPVRRAVLWMAYLDAEFESRGYSSSGLPQLDPAQLWLI